MLERTPIKPFINDLYGLTQVLETHENKRHRIVDFMSSAPCLCYIKNGETGKFEYVNKTFCEVVAKKEIDILGKTAIDVFTLGIAKKMVQCDLDVLKNRCNVMLVGKINGVLYCNE